MMPKDAVGDPASYLIGLDDKPGAALLAASVRDVLVRINNVCAITGLSVPTIYRLMSRNKFPRPVKITAAARAWKLSEITAWVESREPTEGWAMFSTPHSSENNEPVTLVNTTTKAGLLHRAKAAIDAGESSLRDAAEALALAQDDFSATQREIAEAVGRSLGWVNRLLKWRRSGYKDHSPFGEPPEPGTGPGRCRAARRGLRRWHATRYRSMVMLISERGP
jgi:prophage regulatory protein